MQIHLGRLKRIVTKARIEVLKNIILVCLSLTLLIYLLGALLSDDAVLLMWVVDPLLDRAFEVIDAWGFKYKTVGFTWAKTNRTKMGFFTGLGYWTRGNPEMCLLATKGKPKRLNKSIPQLVVSERQEHSRKPDIVYEHIEKMLSGPYIELFARRKRDGWQSWGNEV
jgi:N6-adenosine-specific RNA methylase IME4